MDKRKHKGVMLVFLLFLVLFCIEGLLLFQASIRLKEVEKSYFGAFVLHHPAFEQDYIRIFRQINEEFTWKNPKNETEYYKAGDTLWDKYGYGNKLGIQGKIFLFYGAAMGIIVGISITLMLVILRKNAKKQKRTQDELEHLLEKKQELQYHFEQMKNRMEKEENNTKSLITDLSHQLKTPLSALKMLYEIEETTILSMEEQQEFSIKEWEEVKKLEMLLNSLMELSKLETRMIQIEKKSVSLKDTLRKAVNAVFTKAYEKKIKIIIEEFEDFFIFHDTKWIAEAIINVLDNAIKYSESHTCLTLRMTQLNSYVLMEIEDEGIGISQKEAAKIFQRFYRGNHTVVKTQDGSGIGLYLARKIIEDHGGSISVKPAAKQGSIFRIMLQK